jgi:parallel beta-helix repeat protein
MIQGTGLINSKGITLTKTSNITIQNISVRFFFNGISLTTSKNNHIIDACLFNNSYGIYLQSSNYNMISGNNITDNSWAGIWLYNSQNNNITKNRLANSIANNFGGIKLQDFSDKNNIVDNYIAANKRYGIYIENCWSNRIYHNNFADNVYHAYVDPETSQTNKWDNGYPSGGNYWNDRSKVDFYSGLFQNESGSD